MRSYKAARRAALRQPIEFEVAYEAEEASEVDGEEQPVVVTKTETFTCKGNVSALLLSEFAHNANVEVDTPEGAALLREFFSQAFGDDKEYQRFFRFQTRYGDDDQLMDILGGLVEDFSGRPTERPSTSPATPSTTGPQSKAASLQDGVVVLPGGFTTKATPVENSLTNAVERMASSG